MNDGVSIFFAIFIFFLVFRWLLVTMPPPANTPRRNAGSAAAPSARPNAVVSPDMVETVRAMFPHIPTPAIHWDLQKTGSVELTCDNILRQGSLPLPPSAPTGIVSSGSATTSMAMDAAINDAGSSSSTAVNISSRQLSLVNRYRLQEAVEKNLVPEEPPKVWETNVDKRQQMLQKRKEAMILQARRNYLEKQEKTQKLADPTTTSPSYSQQQLGEGPAPTTSKEVSNEVAASLEAEPPVTSEDRRRQILEATERRLTALASAAAAASSG